MKHKWNSNEWYVWEQNASPMLLIMTLNPSMRRLRDYIGSPLFTTLIMFETDEQGNYQGKWVFRFDEGTHLGQKMVDMLLCPPYRVAFDTGIETGEAQLVQKAYKIQFSEPLEKYDNAKLLELFNEFSEIYYNYYKLAAFVEPVQWRTEQVLTAFLREQISKTNKSAQSDKKVANWDEDLASLAVVSSETNPDARLAEDLRAIFTIEEDTFAVEILEHLSRCAEALSQALASQSQLARHLQRIQGDKDFAETAANLLMSAIRSNQDVKMQALSQILREHSDKYYWKKNNYYSTHFLTEEDTLREIFASEHFDLKKPDEYYRKELAKVRESKSESLTKKEAIVANFPAYYHNVVGLANTVGGSLVDKRKKVVLRANAAFDRIFGVIAARMGVAVSDIRLLIPQELGDFVANPDEYRQRFIERKRAFLVYQSDFPLVDELLSGVGAQSEQEIQQWRVLPMDDPFLAEGDQAEKTLEQLDPRLNILTDINIDSSKLQGITTYYSQTQPEITGIARVIRNPKTESLRTGEVLVAPSTTPDYIDAIQRCKAIVTDWGGQTSHAAITSRELKKPCIIGTNFGSQIIRNGDELKLDLVRGTIEIIAHKGGQ